MIPPTHDPRYSKQYPRYSASRTALPQKQQRRLALLPAPQKRTTSSPMTIAAGFHFSDGVLVSADTQHGAGYRIDASKIFVKEDYGNGLKTVFAFAGRMTSARMGIQHCESALDKLAENSSADDVRSAIEDELFKLYGTSLAASPDEPSEYGFDLIIAVWSPTIGLHSFRSHDTELMEFPGYALAGTGDYLGHYLIRPRYKGRAMSLDEVRALAITSLCSVKGYDDACGGKTESVVLTNDGKISDKRELDISQSETLVIRFWRAANTLLSIVSQLNVAQEQVDEGLDNFCSDVESALDHSRAQHKMQENFEKIGREKVQQIQRDVKTKFRRARQLDKKRPS